MKTAALAVVILFFVLVDDGSRSTRGWLFGAAEPTHKPLIIALVDYLERH